jgi:8-oxo-dGTP pyrophosphatase MutT (NUDIX family)
MITTRAALINAIREYKPVSNEEADFCPLFLSLLNNSDCYQRDYLPGHITGSSFIVDETRTFTLLTNHAKLNKWLQPGGHADGEEDILNVSLREAQEETGLKNFKLLHDTIFDIDVHLIPARKEFPEHYHYDVRFLFEASRDESIILSEESHDLAWKPIRDIALITEQNISMIRLAEKVKLF